MSRATHVTGSDGGEPADARVATEIETVESSDVDDAVIDDAAIGGATAEPDALDDTAGEHEDVRDAAAESAAVTEPAVPPIAPVPGAAVERTAIDMTAHRNAPDTGFPTHRPPPSASAPSSLRSVRMTGVIPAPRNRSVESAFAGLFGDDDGGREWPSSPRAATVRRGASRGRAKVPRRPALGLPALFLFAFAAAFFAWVSATPLWLAVGHGSRGTATVTACNVHGIDRSCADFTAADHSFSTVVTLLGPGTEHAKAGQKLTATVVSRGSSLAYAGTSPDYSLRWIPGVVLLALCGVGIAWATGALRLGDRGARRIAVLGSVAGPFLLLVGMLAYTW